MDYSIEQGGQYINYLAFYLINNNMYEISYTKKEFI